MKYRFSASPFAKLLALAVFLLGTLAFAQTSSDPDFTIIMLPDTQYYAANYPQIFTSQTNWIVSQKSARNIQAVIGVGDIVNGGGSSTQWQNADTSIKVLEGKVPYFLPIGNHDYNKNDPQNRTSSATNFNKYFGPSRYAHSYSGWKGSYPSGSNENFYSFVTINGKQYLIMCLEFFPRSAAVNWAAGIIAANPDKEVIISLHGYGNFDNTRLSLCDNYDAEYYGMGADTDGEELFYNLVRKYPNISLVLSGHIIKGSSPSAGNRTDLGMKGNVINQIMADYQNITNGGNGYLRILKFRPSLNRIEVSTYSPYTGGSLTDSANQFTVPWHADGSLAGTGSLGGKVKNASTCAAVSGAKVSYAGGSATTSSSGTYTISNINPADYTFTTSASGYGTTAKTVQIDPSLQSNWKIFLGSSSNIGTISGTVTNNGSPVNNATVSYDGASTNTVADGTYTLTNVPAGSVQLTASATGLNSVTATVTVTSGVNVKQNFSLSGSLATGATVSGHVRDAANGSPLAGATVSSGSLTTTTAADGSYALQNVPAGSATLSASETGYASTTVTLSLAAGSSVVQDINLNANAAGAGTISGQVTRASDGTPIAGAQVSYNNSTGVATTDASGNYILIGVAPGNYTLTTTAVGFLTATATVTVASGGTTTQSFTLNPPPPAGSVAGQVLDTSGSAIAGAKVTSGSVSALTDATGTYSLAGVPASAAAQVTASASGYNPQTQTVAVADSQTAQLNFSLAAVSTGGTSGGGGSGTGALTGKVTNLSTGSALSGATVSYGGGSTTTNTSGVYTFSSVNPGTYTLTATKSGYMTRSVSATVSGGSTTTSNIQLSTAGKISGTVKNSSGTAISSATVTITGGNIATTVSLKTSTSGTYATGYIPVGSYKVTVAKSGYTTQTKSATVSSGSTSTVSFTMQ